MVKLVVLLGGMLFDTAAILVEGVQVLPTDAVILVSGGELLDAAAQWYFKALDYIIFFITFKSSKR